MNNARYIHTCRETKARRTKDTYLNFRKQETFEDETTEAQRRMKDTSIHVKKKERKTKKELLDGTMTIGCIQPRYQEGVSEYQGAVEIDPRLRGRSSSNQLVNPR